MPKKPPARPAKPSRRAFAGEGRERRRPRGRAGQARRAAAGPRRRSRRRPRRRSPRRRPRRRRRRARPARTPLPDFNLLSRNLAQLIGEGGKVLAAYFRPLENGDFGQPGEDIARMAATLGRIAEYYLSDAQRALAAQAALSRQFLDLWASTLRRLQGEAAAPVAAPDPGDKRFDHPEWRDNPYFDFLKQAYVLTTPLGQGSRRARRRARSADAPQGAVLPAAADERAVAVELRRHQSRAAAHDARRERRESGARPAK